VSYPLFKVLISDTADTHIKNTLESGYIGQGPNVLEFERVFANYLGTKFVLALNSCTSALHLAFHAIRSKYGIGKVLLSPFTCFATTASIIQAGLQPTWVDVDPLTLNLDAQDLARKIDCDTRAVGLVHFAGRYANVNCEGIPVVEDCAHAFGAHMPDGCPVGSDPQSYSCFSFQSVKTLTTGDGGLLKLPNSEDYEKSKLLRWYGMDRDQPRNQDVLSIGFKYHMNDIAAALGLANFEAAAQAVQKQKYNAAYYQENINVAGATLLTYDPQASYWLYPILVDRRDDFISYLKSHGIEASPVHYRNDNYSCVSEFKTQLPGMDSIESRICCIPTGWWIDEESRQFIVDVIRRGW